MAICFVIATVCNAEAKNGIGNGFTNDNNILKVSNAVWVPEHGYVQFQIMVYDTYGDGDKDEWLESANLYINGNKIGRFTKYDGHTFENMGFTATGDYSKQFFIIAKGQVKGSTDRALGNLYEVDVPKNSFYYYTCLQQVNSNHYNVMMRWFPGKLTESTNSVTIKLADIRIQEGENKNPKYAYPYRDAAGNDNGISITVTATNILSKPKIESVEYTAVRGGNVTISHSSDSYPGDYEFIFQSNKPNTPSRAVNMGYGDYDPGHNVTKSIPVDYFRFSADDIA
jgi:hypothetical protein